MDSNTSEIRLLLTMGLNIAVLAGAWRLARRWGGADPIQRVLDTLLGWYLVQYLAVTGPGALGILSTTSMSVVALIMAIAMWMAGGGVRTPAVRAKRGWIGYAGVAAGLFATGFEAAFISSQRYAPVMANDGLGYHMPMAVLWLQSGHLRIDANWYWNPANLFTPAASESFMAWLTGPMQSDVLARFVQVGGLMLIFFAVVKCVRSAGADAAVAGLVAAAVALSRPMFSQSVLMKDDLFVTGFFLAAAAACFGSAIRDRLVPWRLGAAVGLLLAVKTTALLTLPVLLLFIIVPRRIRRMQENSPISPSPGTPGEGWGGGLPTQEPREEPPPLPSPGVPGEGINALRSKCVPEWTRRQWLIRGGIVCLLVVPWYLRNLILTGNPLYPMDLKIAGLHVLHGLFTIARDPLMNTPAGLWKILTQGYYGMPISVAGFLAAGWILLLILSGRQAWRDPLTRLALWGFPLGLLTFAVAAPLAEIRFVFPFIPLLFVCFGAALAKLKLPAVAWPAAAGLLVASFTTTFNEPVRSEVLLEYAATGLIVAAVGVLLLCWPRRRRREILGLVFASATVAVAMFVYVDWNAYLATCEATAAAMWEAPCGDIAQAWKFVRDPANIPPDATIAYANTDLIYPLYGPAQAHRVFYAPVRSDVHEVWDYSWIGDQLNGYPIAKNVAAMLDQHADADVWRKNLRNVAAGYLFIAKTELVADPPELRFAEADPAEFTAIFENSTAVVFQISQK